MAIWSDFQTAIQFVAGLNVALFGIPELRAPGITSEKRQESDLIKFAISNLIFDKAVEYQDQFERNWESLDILFKIAMFLCLGMAILQTGFLFSASGGRASVTADVQTAWFLIALGFLPSVVIALVNLLAGTYRKASFDMRNELTRIVQDALEARKANIP